jgi:hypothetical protein
LYHIRVLSPYVWCRSTELYISYRLLWGSYAFCSSSSRVLDLYLKLNRDCNFQIEAEDNFILVTN